MAAKQQEARDEEVRARMVAFLPRLRRFCMALAGGADAGDDLAQNTIVRALARIDQWQPDTKLESWMYRIAQNIRIDEARAARTRGIRAGEEELLTLKGEDGVRIVEARSEHDAARAAMSGLPEEQRAVLALVVLDGLSYRDAAESLEIPIGTVMSRLARARAAIDRRLNGGEA